MPPDGQGYQGTILATLPTQSTIVLNLERLYRDKAFLAALSNNQADIVGFHDGAGRYKNLQSEVVLEIESVSPDDVYSLGGYSSPLEDLIICAGQQIYGRNPTEPERKRLLLSSEKAGVKDGAHWLGMDATKRVLARTKPKAAELKLNQSGNVP